MWTYKNKSRSSSSAGSETSEWHKHVKKEDQNQNSLSRSGNTSRLRCGQHTQTFYELRAADTQRPKCNKHTNTPFASRAPPQRERINAGTHLLRQDRSRLGMIACGPQTAWCYSPVLFPKTPTDRNQARYSTWSNNTQASRNHLFSNLQLTPPPKRLGNQ